MALHLPARPGAPVACDLSTATDTPDERLAAYRRLFGAALERAERAERAVVFTFRSNRAQVEDLARREAACCPFLDYRVETTGDEVVWTITNPGSAEADAVLDAVYALPGRGDAGLRAFLGVTDRRAVRS